MDISKCHTIAPAFTRLPAVVTQWGFCKPFHWAVDL